MIIKRSDQGNLHREGLPAIDTPQLKQYWWMGKLHRSDGPAVITPGASTYYWRGLYIQQELWDASRSYTLADVLKIKNIELRRAILEKVGFSRFEKDARVLDTGQGDFTGCLLLELKDPHEQGDDRVIRFLKLKNSTPEPDGSYHYYFLRVPPRVKSVREGVSWSFAVEGEWKYVVQA